MITGDATYRLKNEYVIKVNKELATEKSYVLADISTKECLAVNKDQDLRDPY